MVSGIARKRSQCTGSLTEFPVHTKFSVVCCDSPMCGGIPGGIPGGGPPIPGGGPPTPGGGAPIPGGGPPSGGPPGGRTGGRL